MFDFNIKNCTLGLQHVCAMFGATILVPILTGLDVSIALLSAGLGTLLFHYITKGVVPVFLGSSFAFIPGIALVLSQYGLGSVKTALIVTGLMYVLYSYIIKLYGVGKIKSLLPPVVVGSIIVSIGLKLVPIALSMAGYSKDALDYKSLAVALFTLSVVLLISFTKHKTIRLVPIFISIIAGYLLAMALGMVDFSIVANAPIFGFNSNNIPMLLQVPEFNLSAILIIAPLSLVVLLEHIGDIESNGAVVGKNFVKDPGLNKTVMADGFATILAGFLGAPANTTYGENTGVLAATKNYNPSILRIAALFAILLAFLGKVSAVISSIPVAVMGGISMLLFGLIASIGLKTLVNSKVDFNKYKNLVIPAIVIILGVFVDNITIVENIAVSGLFLATLTGIILNKILPES